MDFTTATWPPWCIAHRGNSADFPENSFSAFDSAVQAPIRAMETDIQLSRDDVPMIYHNRSLRMVGGGLRKLANQNQQTLRSLDIGAWFGTQHQGQLMPSLEELLLRYGKQTYLLLEIKVRESKQARLDKLVDLLLYHIEALQLDDRVMILCFDLKLLSYSYGRNPRLRYVWNQKSPARLAPEAPWLFAYSLQHQALNPSLVATLHGAGKPIMTFTVNDNRTLARVMKLGVNGVMANDPFWLAHQITELDIDQGRRNNGSSNCTGHGFLPN